MAAPLVHILAAGGTIASRADTRTGEVRLAVRADELVTQVPELAEYAEVQATEFALMNSWNITPATMFDLARTVAGLLSGARASGVVITQGTDTIEETAFALDLLLDSEAPVIVTGAMRNASLPGADGPRNLLSSVRVAADPAARGLGVLVVMNDEVHAARYVAKTHSTALSAFTSPGVGPIGLVDDAGLWIRWRPMRVPHLPLAHPDPRVYLVKMAAGMDDLLLRAVLDAGGSGIVIEGTGNVYEGWVEALRDLGQAGIPVVLVSRCAEGRVIAMYGGRGGGFTLPPIGVIPGGGLSGLQAHLALTFALGAGLGRAEIRDYVGRLGGHDHLQPG